MSVTTHYDTLSQKHAKLEAEIHNAYTCHMDDNYIQELKKQKLHLKEEMAAIRMHAAA